MKRTTTLNNTKKMVLTAMFASLAFVLSTFVYFHAMAPFQHFVNVMAAVILEPWYGCMSALLLYPVLLILLPMEKSCSLIS